MLKKLILKNRSYRRFEEDFRIQKTTLIDFIDLARNSPSSRNQQSLKYVVTCDKNECNEIFKNLKWAGYLKDGTPKAGERPSAYICMLNDKNISQNVQVDAGIAAQSILLGAVERGLGGCIIGSVNKSDLAKFLNLTEHLEILYVIALGKPLEIVILEEKNSDDDIRYWRDDNKVHHVPKRSLKDIIINYK